MRLAFQIIGVAIALMVGDRYGIIAGELCLITFMLANATDDVRAIRKALEK